ncbi:hypothetical protein MmiHf6_07070 [Methanimicrococcus hongohii]|uniref:Antitoxin SocA-like Panacea domain-containing protein n=1 Tax=Methanimicrococcus hongohii TaxID=3028295 RepID=A0AA96V171_9EURY|nr:type II toxin-antitoxin system antitoxin SocA domain-containing protein [Methanimicrococcus sp. Hf6]WNY23400.1 hypothetical protein MmiHf6_07070 [Methanimicrococcus sp. Hf6]
MDENKLPDIFDVADWFLNKEPLQHKKLQKLCYYAVAWTYTLLDKPLCTNSDFQAWIHGPANPMLYQEYKQYGWLHIPQKECDYDFDEAEDVLEFVWASYGDLTQFQLENLTHDEEPWQIARGDLGDSERSEAIISAADMKKYYAKIYEESQND